MCTYAKQNNIIVLLANIKDTSLNRGIPCSSTIRQNHACQTTVKIIVVIEKRFSFFSSIFDLVGVMPKWRF